MMDAMASGKVTPDERANILAVLRETENVRETARRVARDPATVSRIAKAAGLDVAQRCQTKNATAAKLADAKALRAEENLGFLRDAARLRQQMFAPTVEKKAMTVSLGGDSGSCIEIVEVHLDEPTFADKQRIMTSRAIAIDKSLAIERHDDDGAGDVSDVDAWVDGMLAAA